MIGKLWGVRFLIASPRSQPVSRDRSVISVTSFLCLSYLSAHRASIKRRWRPWSPDAGQSQVTSEECLRPAVVGLGVGGLDKSVAFVVEDEVLVVDPIGLEGGDERVGLGPRDACVVGTVGQEQWT